jgi:CxxC motif-containing protein
VGCHLEVDIENNYKVTGNSCPKGEVYGKEELTAPKRVVTSTIIAHGGIYRRVPVKTASPIPKELQFKCMELLKGISVNSPCVKGTVVVENLLGTGINIVTTRSI